MRAVERILSLLLVLSTAAAALGADPASAGWNDAESDLILDEAARRSGTTTDQAIGLLGREHKRRGLPAAPLSTSGEGTQNYNPADEPERPPSAILGAYQRDVSRGADDGTTGGDDAPRRDKAAGEKEMMIPFLQEEISVNSGQKEPQAIPQAPDGDGEAFSVLRGEDVHIYDNVDESAAGMKWQDEVESGASNLLLRRIEDSDLTYCSEDMCSFAVTNNGTYGLLSRTGGDKCDDPTCQYLVLNSLNIHTIAPNAFAGMVHLRVLSLSSNQLRSISYEHLKDLTALRDLDLRSNRISSIAPGTFSGLAELKDLDLSSNLLSSFADGTFSTLSSLEKLDLESNYFKSIRTGYFAGLSSLKQLKLGTSYYNSQWRIRIIEDGSFDHMPQLESLELFGHDLSSITNNMFRGLSKLRSLNLGKYLSRSTEDLLRIESRAFADLSGLERLLISRAGVNYIEPGLFRNCRNINHLTFYGNPIKALTTNTFTGMEKSLKHLDLESCLISSVGSRTFRRLSQLEQLDLSSNLIAILHLEIFQNISLSHYVHLGYNPNLVCRPKSSQENSATLATRYPSLYLDDSEIRLCPVQPEVSSKSCLISMAPQLRFQRISIV